MQLTPLTWNEPAQVFIGKISGTREELQELYETLGVLLLSSGKRAETRSLIVNRHDSGRTHGVMVTKASEED